MQIETLEVGQLGTRCYIAEGLSSEAFIIDPGDDALNIAETLQARSLKVAMYILTHGHFDHVGALASLIQKYPAPVAIHPVDLEWAFDPSNAMPPYFDAPERPEMTEKLINEADTFTVAGLECVVLHTPGHTPGSVCIHIPEESVLFSGDTLFCGSIGRTDFPGGNMDQMKESLNRLSKLPAETKVYSGHGPATTIERELKTNPFLTGLR